jgi:putative hydrolase of the HAD superfamily
VSRNLPTGTQIDCSIPSPLGHAHCLGVSVEPADYAEHVPTEVGRAINPDIHDSVIRDATDQRIARFERVLSSVPQSTLSTLSDLRAQGLKTALISNADSIETQAWDSSPLAPLFDVTVLSWQVGLAKPDARIYQYCLDRLNMPASRGAFVGDGGSDELSGARAVGLLPIFATGLAPALTEQEVRNRKSSAAHVIHDLEELLG